MDRHPPRTPYQRKIELAGVSIAEVALLRTTMRWAQTKEQRQKAMDRLRELGLDPTCPVAK